MGSDSGCQNMGRVNPLTKETLMQWCYWFFDAVENLVPLILFGMEG